MRTFTASSGKPPAGNSLFVDTWGWLVLEDGKDPAHSRAVDVRRKYSAQGTLVTTDYVLDETFTRLFARRPFPEAATFDKAILEAAGAGALLLERVTRERFERAWRLRLRYQDKPRISFTDLTSFVVMKELGIRNVLTAHTHFVQVQADFSILP